jgi:paraquat-inducible protein B
MSADPPTSTARTGVPDALPVATVRPPRRWSWTWIVPLLALVLAGGLVVRTLRLQGTAITITFADAHGLQPGDPLRYRGMVVGEVRSIALSDDLSNVTVTASLFDSAGTIARRGARFWIVRPEISMARIEGLETLLGPRYLAALPGNGATQRHFVGLEQPPVLDAMVDDSLEIVLRADTRAGLARGAPVLFRDVRVGSVVQVGLASDGGSVEARVRIDRTYAALVRERTRFWKVSGVNAQVGLTGFSIDVESLETLLHGGVQFATPPLDESGAAILAGHRFDLAAEPEPIWRQWEPGIPIGAALLPSTAIRPNPLRAQLAWEQGSLISRNRQRTGWVLLTDQGLLGPADLLTSPQQAKDETAYLEIAGQPQPVNGRALVQQPLLALVEPAITASVVVWPQWRCRSPEEVEDCLAFIDSVSPPIPLAAAKLEWNEDALRWAVHASMPLDPQWHGAAVVARSDGDLIGMLLLDDEASSAVVALLPSFAGPAEGPASLPP